MTNPWDNQFIRGKVSSMLTVRICFYHCFWAHGRAIPWWEGTEGEVTHLVAAREQKKRRGNVPSDLRLWIGSATFQEPQSWEPFTHEPVGVTSPKCGSWISFYVPLLQLLVPLIPLQLYWLPSWSSLVAYFGRGKKKSSMLWRETELRTLLSHNHTAWKIPDQISNVLQFLKFFNI